MNIKLVLKDGFIFEGVTESLVIVNNRITILFTNGDYVNALISEVDSFTKIK